MASVKKRDDSPYWVACFTLPNGERKQVSSHTTDKIEAQQKALIYEKTSHLAKKKRLDEGTGRRVLQQIALAAGHDSAEGLTVSGYLKEQLALLAHMHKGRTLESYSHALEHFRDDSGLADLPLHQVSAARAVDWKDRLVKEGLHAATINHQLGTLRRSFAPAVQKEWLERNPWAGVIVPGAKKNRQRRQAFTFQHFEGLLNATEAEAKKKEPAIEHAGEWQLLIRVAGYSGQRRTDCAQLTGEQVDLPRGVMKFWRRKNKDWHVHPIHPALRPALAAAMKQHGNGRLLPALAALPATGRKSVSDIFRQQVLPLIGIIQPYGNKESGRKIAPYSFHSLRHGLSTWLNDEGVSDADRRGLVGHQDREVSLGYTHTGLKHAKRAMRKVPTARR